MCAIGTFDPEIEIWDLTTVDSLQPAAVLGGYEEEDPEEAEMRAMAEAEMAGEAGGDREDEDTAALTKNQKKKRKKKLREKKKKAASKMPERKTLKEGSHRDAVLSLAWNWEFRNVLASGSADKTLKIWDLEKLQCVQTLRHHSDKVQSVSWNPSEAHVILSGGFDKRAFLSDMRGAGAGDSSVWWDLQADVESMIWDPHVPTCFLASCEDGSVCK